MSSNADHTFIHMLDSIQNLLVQLSTSLANIIIILNKSLLAHDAISLAKYCNLVVIILLMIISTI